MILFIVAYVLLLPLTIINYFCVSKSGYFKSTAVNIDRFANREFRAMLNKFLKQPQGYKFGDERETISSALGKNQRNNTLTKTGKALCAILDFIDKDHCKKSIQQL
jgi:hypothetical protein